jgi:hypothetical protein
MLAEQLPASALIRPRPVGPGLGEYLDQIVFGADCHQAQTDQSAEPMYARVSIASASRSRNCEPDLIGRPHSVDRLEQQIEVEAELHFDDGQARWFPVSHGDDVAAVHLALHLKAEFFQETLHGRIESGLEHAAQPATCRRVAATAQSPARLLDARKGRSKRPDTFTGSGPGLAGQSSPFRLQQQISH